MIDTYRAVIADMKVKRDALNTVATLEACIGGTPSPAVQKALPPAVDARPQKARNFVKKRKATTRSGMASPAQADIVQARDAAIVARHLSPRADVGRRDEQAHRDALSNRTTGSTVDQPVREAAAFGVAKKR